MKNYLDKYLKYKLKYLKIKNLQLGGYAYDCTDEANAKIICEPKPEGQWDNLEECTKSNICIENSKINNEYMRQHKAIMLIRKNKNLLEEYGIYKNGNIDPNLVETVNLIPDLEDLENILDSINFIKEKKPLFENYGVYKKGYKIPEFSKLKEGYLKLINFIEENKQIFALYGIYNTGDDLVSLVSVKNNDPNRLLRVFKQELSKIKLIEDNSLYIDHKIQVYNQYKDNMTSLEKFLEFKTIKIPNTFYISGLLRFAVYKNEKINKIIYLLGEQHILQNLCDNVENKTQDLIPIYNADDFFFSLLKCGIKGKNNLDVFLEMEYKVTSKYSKFTEVISKKHKNGYLAKTIREIYNNDCKPIYIKNLLEENTLCLYDPNVRFHHADLRHSGDDFVKYIGAIFILFAGGESSDEKIKFFQVFYSKYDKNKLLEFYKSSIFIKKIKKQINNIKIDYIKQFFNECLSEFDKICIDNINSGDLTFNNIKPLLDKKNYKETIFITIRYIYLAIMDIYLMSRAFRTFVDKFDEIYNASNIIIYAGDLHIDKYITWLKQLGFEEKYNVSNSTNLEKIACLKVDNFNIDYF